MDGHGLLAGLAALSVLAMAAVPSGAGAAQRRFMNAEDFVYGTARRLVPSGAQAPAVSAEEAARHCLAQVAGAQGTEALVQAAIGLYGSFRLSPAQEEAFGACLARAGYRFRPSLGD